MSELQWWGARSRGRVGAGLRQALYIPVRSPPGAAIRPEPEWIYRDGAATIPSFTGFEPKEKCCEPGQRVACVRAALRRLKRIAQGWSAAVAKAAASRFKEDELGSSGCQWTAAHGTLLVGPNAVVID